MAGIKTIIVLSFVLAIGFLLVILSATLYHDPELTSQNNYLTFIVAATFVMAPLPNWICGRCANPDDFIETAGNAIVDFGRWFTGFLVTMGIVLPIVLASVGTIGIPAMIMSIIGGGLIYGTIITFSLFFQEQEEF